MAFDIVGGLFNFGQDVYNNWQAGERQDDAQNFSQQEAAAQRSFNSAEALANREWQERMSNTAAQRHKADLIAAGFNPLLAVHPGGGATTPSGGAASSGIASAGIASPGTGHSITAGMATASQINVNEAQADKLRAEADEARERTLNYDPQRREIESKIPVNEKQVELMTQQIGESAVRIEKIWEEVSQVKASAANLTQQTANLKETIPLIRTQIQNLRALTAQSAATTDEIKQRVKENLPQMERILMNITKIQGEMAQPGHANAERAQDSWVGQLGAYMRALMPLNSVIGAVPVGRGGAAARTPDERTRWRNPPK